MNQYDSSKLHYDYSKYTYKVSAEEYVKKPNTVLKPLRGAIPQRGFNTVLKKKAMIKSLVLLSVLVVLVAVVSVGFTKSDTIRLPPGKPDRYYQCDSFKAVITVMLVNNSHQEVAKICTEVHIKSLGVVFKYTGRDIHMVELGEYCSPPQVMRQLWHTYIK